MRIQALTAITLLTCSFATYGADAFVPPQYVELTLHRGLFQKNGPDERSPELVFEIMRQDGRWSRAIGIARDFNVSTHSGQVLNADLGDDALTLKINFRIVGDSWIRGGPAIYQIDLKRLDDGRLEGTYTGTFRGVPVEGRATGVIYRPEPKMGADFRPVQPGEHPRVLFRKHQLPELRRKMKTPFGVQAMKKLGNGLVALGLKYQLTGDAKYAEAAQKEAAETVYRGKNMSAAFAPARTKGLTLERVAVALDLCWDAWPEEFKQDVILWIQGITYKVFYDPQKISRSANWHVASNHVGSLYAGIAISGLVLWGEKGAMPARPTPPTVDLKIPPMREAPPKGAPVVEMVPGQTPRKWLATDALPFVLSANPMVSMQGLENLRPQPGQRFDLEGQELYFEATQPAEVADGGICIGDMLEKNQKSATFAGFTVIEVQDPGLYKIHVPFTQAGTPQLALNGKLVAHGQVVRLEKGKYAATLLARMMVKWKHIAVEFHPAGERDLPASEKVIAQRQREYNARLLEWKIDVADWKRLNGANVAFTNMFQMGRRVMYMHYREAVGDGGFVAEISHYGIHATDGPNRYATAFRHCFGYDVSPFPDITDLLPRKVMAHTYPENGEPHAQDINGHASIDEEYFASLFPIVPEKWKPEILWAWNRHHGVTDKSTRANVVRRRPAWAFVNYPLDMEPVEPGARLPLVWEADDFGYYVFRNRWQNDDDFVTQVFLKAHHIGGWNGPNAGTFRIRGLGHNWAVGVSGRERRRWTESVVWMPEVDHHEGSLGIPDGLQTWEDGSGSISVDLANVYAKRVQFSRYGNIRREYAFEPSGITGQRAIAVDYSGKSGAPCLFVVADEINGGSGKIWLWHVPQEKVNAVKVNGNVFSLRQGDASMQVTLVAPDNVRISADAETMKYTVSAGHSSGKTATMTMSAVKARGGPHFLAVATIQKGAPPRVQTSGRGLDTVVRVGNRTIRYRDGRIVFE